MFRYRDCENQCFPGGGGWGVGVEYTSAYATDAILYT